MFGSVPSVELLRVGEPVADRVEAVGVLRGRVGADRDLLAVGQAVAVGVGLGGIELAAALLPVVEPVAVGVGQRGSVPLTTSLPSGTPS